MHFSFSIYFYSFFSSYQHFSHSTFRSLRDVAIPNRITMIIKEWCIKVDQCTRIVPPTGTALFCTSVIIVIICTELVSNYSMWSKCITYQKKCWKWINVLEQDYEFNQEYCYIKQVVTFHTNNKLQIQTR